MAFITTYAGEVQLLKYMLNYAPADNVKLHLYTNNYTPTQNDTTGNYTESSAAGYAPIVLTGSNWTVATTTGTSHATYAQQTFSYTTSEAVYGYYITNNASSIVIFGERFSGAPFQLPVGGGTIDVDPDITLI